jgi:hypothetical protein
MELSDMAEPVETLTREQWEELVFRNSTKPPDEYRRGQARRDTAWEPVQLAFQKLGDSVVRNGKLMNASAGGVMVRLTENLDYGTMLVMRVIFADQPVVLVGRVVHCTETIGAYKIGIELQFGDGPG